MQNRSGLIILIYILIYLVFFPLKNLSSIENSAELYKKGARLAIKGKLDNAIDIFKKVIRISPHYCLGYYGLGKAYLYKHGTIDEAIKNLKQAVRLDRNLPKGHFYLGIAYFLSEKYEYALHSFNNAYKYDDSCIEALYNTGVIYDILKKYYKSNLYFKRYLDEKIKKDEDILF